MKTSWLFTTEQVSKSQLLNKRVFVGLQHTENTFGILISCLGKTLQVFHFFLSMPFPYDLVLSIRLTNILLFAPSFHCVGKHVPGYTGRRGLGISIRTCVMPLGWQKDIRPPSKERLLSLVKIISSLQEDFTNLKSDEKYLNSFFLFLRGKKKKNLIKTLRNAVLYFLLFFFFFKRGEVLSTGKEESGPRPFKL